MTVLESLQRLFGTSYSDKALENFIESLRHPPLTTTLRVNTLKCTREKAKEDLEEYFKQVLNRKDMHLIRFVGSKAFHH